MGIGFVASLRVSLAPLCTNGNPLGGAPLRWTLISNAIACQGGAVVRRTVAASRYAIRGWAGLGWAGLAGAGAGRGMGFCRRPLGEKMACQDLTYSQIAHCGNFFRCNSELAFFRWGKNN